jgi:hypothetical protein
MSSQASQQTPTKPQTPYVKMYYIRVAFAVFGGILNGALDLGVQNPALGDFGGVLGILLGVAIFAFTFVLFRYIMKDLASRVLDIKKFTSVGIFSFFIFWFLAWVISINFLFPIPS